MEISYFHVNMSSLGILRRQHVAARKEADAAVASAQLQSMQHQELLAESHVQLTSTRGQLHACQAKLETLEQHFQNSQDHLHQATAELQVSCASMPVTTSRSTHLLHLWCHLCICGAIYSAADLKWAYFKSAAE